MATSRSKAPEGVTRAYRRISLETERSGSLRKQTDRLSAWEFAKGRNPEEMVWYEDQTVSGSKIPMADRPEGGRLWNEISQGDRVLITKIDRAARNLADLLDLVQHCHNQGATITFIDNDID